MFLVLVELKAKPSAASEVESILSRLVDVAFGEPGSVIYAVHRKQDKSNAFVLYELYKNRTAWESHLAIEVVQRALEQFKTLLMAAPRVVYCDTVALAGVGQARRQSDA